MILFTGNSTIVAGVLLLSGWPEVTLHICAWFTHHPQKYGSILWRNIQVVDWFAHYNIFNLSQIIESDIY